MKTLSEFISAFQIGKLVWIVINYYYKPSVSAVANLKIGSFIVENIGKRLVIGKGKVNPTAMKFV